MIKKLLIFLLISISGSELPAQKAPMKFGDVDIEDLKMTVYPNDTSAPAVILCDYGFFRESNIQFTRLLRVKILKKEGYYWANQVFPTNPQTKVRGITSNLVDGKIVQEKLRNESVFTERVTEQNYRLRIAMPNVKTGSVLDFEFMFPGIPYEWRFQDEVPERYNELNIGSSPRIRFRTTFYGLEKLSVATPDRWIAHDVHAFKEEPYMNSKENFITKLQINLLEIVNYHIFASTWDNIFQDMMYFDNFGKALDLSGYLNDLAKSIRLTGLQGVQLMKAAFDSIRVNMKWNEKESCYTSSPTLSTVYKKKTGNSADINMMLLQLLRKLDIKSVPVILSTRSNGILSPIIPSYSRFNYIIVEASVEGSKYLLDATDTYCPYYLLPFRSLNYNGRIVVEHGSMSVDLTPNRIHKKVTMYNLETDEDLDLKGDLTTIHADYAALDFRKKYHSFNSQDEFIEDFRKDKVGLSILNTRLDNIDSIYKPVVENYSINISNYLNRVGNELYLTPFIYDQLTENPFKSEERKYPVDYGYRSENTIITTIKIPEGYGVTALPSKVLLKTPNNSVVFIFEAVNTNSEIKVTGKLSVNKGLIMVDEYQDLRAFYDQLVKKVTEPLILKKL